MVGAHIKPQHVGIIFVNGLKASGDPVVHEFDAGLIAPVGDAVKRRPLRVIQIAVQQIAAGRRCRNKLEMKKRMIRDAGLQSGFPHRCDEVAVEVAVRAVVFGVEWINLAVPVGKTVVMLAGSKDIFRAGILEQIRPRVGIPLCCREHREKILVAEFSRRPEMLRVPVHNALVAAIHITHIPLAGVCRHRINAPVHINAKLAVAKPVGVFVVLLDGIPAFLKRSRPGGRNIFERGGDQFGRVVPPDIRAGDWNICRGEGAGQLLGRIGGAGAAQPQRRGQSGGCERGCFQEFTACVWNFHGDEFWRVNLL